MTSPTTAKINVQKFWDQNPCGGDWVSFEKKITWAFNVEPYILNYLRDDLLRNKHVLEIGCGQGFLLALLAKKSSKAVGLDLSNQSLHKARCGLTELRLQNFELVQGDAEKLPFDNQSFDTAYSIGVLHHTANTQKSIDEIYRVLKNNGTGIIMLYRKYTPKWLVVVTLRYLARLFNLVNWKQNRLIDTIRKSEKYNNSNVGTAAVELFGCPVLKMYSFGQIKKMFKSFSSVKLTSEQPGFVRFLDFTPFGKKLLRPFCGWLDKHTKKIFGFYAVIEVKK